MALMNPVVQGSCATFPSRSSTCNRGIKWRQLVNRIDIVANRVTFSTLTCKSCLSVGRRAHFTQVPKAKCLRVSSFKGSAQNDDASESRNSGSNSCKDSVKLSYQRAAGSSAIQNLFRNWLLLLHNQPSSHLVEEDLSSEDQNPKLFSEITENRILQKERRGILKSVWFYFWSLDATIKMLILIFIPGFLAVNIVYGSVVSRELTPLWVLGPLIIALYVKMMRGIFVLYVFAFNQTIKLIKNMPSYSLTTYKYNALGKLKEEICTRLWKPLDDMKNKDFKEYMKRKWKDFEIWRVDKYMDFVESIWPYYCRTIRFLKRANLM